MFKSKKKKDKDENGKTGTSVKSSENSENLEDSGNDSDLFKFSMNKRVSIDRPSPTEGSAREAKDALSLDSIDGDKSQKTSKSKSSTSSSKIRKSILKNNANASSPLLTSPQENVEMEIKDSKHSQKSMRFVASGDALDSVKASEAQKRRELSSKSRRSLNLSIPKIPLVTHKSFDENLLLPKIYSTKTPEPRELVLKQNFAGDYGFTVKTSTLLEKVPLTGEIIERNIHFAESSANSSQTTGLLPGDKLLKINDTHVEGLPKDKLLELIKATKSPEIKITVQPVPELLELCQRCGLEDNSSLAAITDRNFDKKSKTAGKSEEALKAESQYTLTPSYWLVHSEGYSGCTVLNEQGSNQSGGGGGQTRVKLTESGSSLLVDEADLEKCNPSELDTVEDICKLRYVNESSILHVLRTRYSGNELFHTFCGYNLLVINPAHTTNAYNDKAMTVLKKCASKEEMPPHIFSMAQLAYRRMIASRRDQSVVFLGQSGSGKSENLNHALKYLTTNAGSTNNIVTADKMVATQTVLSSFGSCRSSQNGSASKFTQIVSIEFDYGGTISGANIQGILLEKSRLTNYSERKKAESGFSIFSQMVYGCNEDEAKLWSLPKTFPGEGGKETYFSHKAEVAVHGSRGLSSHVYSFKRLKNAFEVLGVSKAEQDAIFGVTAAIFHLLLSGSVKSGNKYEFADQESAEKAAHLLGVKLQTLTRATFYGSVTGVGSSALSARAGRGMRAGAGANLDLSGLASKDMLEGMAMGLYQDLFNAVLSLTNRSLSANYKSNIAMQLIDAPGLIKNSYDDNDKGNSLEDLFVNYTHERLHQLFHDSTVASPLKLFEQERIEVDFEDSMPTDPSLIIDMLDQSPLKKLSNDDEEVEVKGLLWVLDEESIFPDVTCEMMLNKVTTIYGDRADGLLSRKGTTLSIRHCQGSSPVTYNAENWLQRCKENPVCRMSLPMLQESSSVNIAEVFGRLRSYVSGTVAGTIGGGDALNLRRQTQVRRGFSSIAAVKKNSLCLQVKFQLDFVLELLRHTQMNFVLCMMPNMKCAQDLGSYSSIDVPFLRAQVQATQIVSAARMFRVGYPDNVHFDIFIRSYSMLVSVDSFVVNPLDERATSQSLCEALEIPAGCYAVGVTKLFFRCGVLVDLDERRDEKIGAVIVDFQAYCRAYSARRHLQKLQMQNRAVACVQKNIRLFWKVRQWDWWKLYIRVLPLARVALSEEERRAKVANLEEATRKLEQKDSERTELTSRVARLEQEVEEMGLQLSEEQAGLQHTTQLYEQELLNRRSLEEQVKSLKAQLASSEKENGKMEMELTGLRHMANSSLFNSSSLDGVQGQHALGSSSGGSEEDYLDEVMFKNKLLSIKKQAEIDRKRLEMEMEDERGEWGKAKKSLDRKLGDLRDDLEDKEHAVTQLKRKAAKFQEELQDTNLVLNQQVARNTELERKQRKFDVELNQAQQQTVLERQLKEKLSAEKENFAAESYALSREKEELAESLQNAESKIRRLQSEIDDLTENQNQASEVTVLKRDKHSLQSKIKDQEDELDELAGEVSGLEAAKLRLEMEMGKVRSDLTRELEMREEEFEQGKQNYVKKVRSLESQLDDEIHERQIIYREKLELERKIKSESLSKNSGDIERERKLQKQLVRARAQLSEMQGMLDGMSEQCTSAKRENRSLRHQLEEARDTADAALSSKASLQRELQDIQQELDQWKSQYYAMEDKTSILMSDKSELETQLEEAEEDMAGLERKLRNVIAEAAIDRNSIHSLTTELAEVRRNLADKEEQLSGLQSKCSQIQATSTDKALLLRAESRATEVERSLGVEKALRVKCDNQISRLKAQSDKHSEEVDALLAAQKQKEETIKKLNNQIRDVKDDLLAVESKYEQSQTKKHDLERQLGDMEETNGSLKQELNVAAQRIQLLQRSLQEMNNADNASADSSFYLSDEEDDVDGASLMNSEDDEEDLMADVSGNNGMERSEFTSEDEDYGSAAAEFSSTAGT